MAHKLFLTKEGTLHNWDYDYYLVSINQFHFIRI